MKGVSLFLLAAVIGVGIPISNAKLACLTTEECQESLRIGSECVDGFCSNPFERGCLKTMIESRGKDEIERIKNLTDSKVFENLMSGRVCNSDDFARNSTSCLENVLDYFEIRIHGANWESSIFVAWVMQIVLMEILKVPASVGLNSGISGATSFYSPANGLEYSSTAYPWDALRRNVSEGCHTTDEDCIDVMTEVWNGQISKWTEMLQDGIIDPADGNGQVGKLGWFVPGSTAGQDPSLLSYYGLQGEENRHKLAETFKRPTTWYEYCEEVSPDNCTTPDEVAVGYPDDSQTGSYYAGDSYTGYFRMLPENNCTEFPDTCTGYFIGPLCTWSTNVDAQIRWNNIVGLKLDGPNAPNGGYTYGEELQIWRAANRTRSDVIMWWWQPEPLVEELSFSTWNFQEIILPTVTNKCFKSRVSVDDRCSEDITVRQGDPMGGCDEEAHSLQKIVSSVLSKQTRKKPETLRSPGYPFVKALKITDLEIQSILNDWIAMGVDKYGNDARETVCSWVVDNLETLVNFIPPGHPRDIVRTGSFDTGYIYFAMAIAVLSLLVLIFITGVVHHYRKVKVFIYAQEIFVKIILLGFLFEIIGGAMYSFEPTDSTCIARSWLTSLGFSTVLSAVLVKMSTINRIMQKSKRCKRIQVSRKAMFSSLGALVAIDQIYLIVWTVVSPPKATEHLVLVDEFENTVESRLMCQSDPSLWYYGMEAWHFLLLLVASVLAFQSRDIVPAFNESRSIGIMVYSFFLFMILRLIVFGLGDRGMINPSVMGASLCLLYVVDTLFATVIYIVPKCFQARKDPNAYITPRESLNSTGPVTGSKFIVNSQRSDVSINMSQGSLDGGSNHLRKDEKKTTTFKMKAGSELSLNDSSLNRVDSSSNLSVNQEKDDSQPLTKSSSSSDKRDSSQPLSVEKDHKIETTAGTTPARRDSQKVASMFLKAKQESTRDGSSKSLKRDSSSKRRTSWKALTLTGTSD